MNLPRERWAIISLDILQAYLGLPSSGTSSETMSRAREEGSDKATFVGPLSKLQD
jgi:hypothetical protein